MEQELEQWEAFLDQAVSQNPGAGPVMPKMETIHTENPQAFVEHFAAKRIKTVSSPAPFTGFQAVMSLEPLEE